MSTNSFADTLPNKPRTRRSAEVRRADSGPSATRRDRPRTSDPYTEEDTREYLRRQGGGRRVRRGLIPQSKFGRIAAAAVMLLFLGGMAAASLYTLRFLHHDPQFTIPSSAAVELRGNQHLSRSQLLSVFGEDVERNIFAVPLAERQEQLQQIPWVERASVMRLLPNRLRVQVVERTPIAFVRQGGTIGMADASGVLLDIPPDAPGNPNYSFPVVTGLKATDSPESRAQRMHLYAAFLQDMDSGGKNTSPELSEIDISDPEDVKVLLPSNHTETMVHFGTQNFLARYRRFQEHIAEWQQQYPRLSSVDMRYERQVVLQMPPKDSTVTPSEGRSIAATSVATVTSKKAAATEASIKDPQQTTASARAVLIFPKKPGEPVAQRTRPLAEGHAATGIAAHPTPSQQADTAKRVEAIKAWMAKRQAAREATKAQTATQ